MLLANGAKGGKTMKAFKKVYWIWFTNGVAPDDSKEITIDSTQDCNYGANKDFNFFKTKKEATKAMRDIKRILKVRK